MGQGSGDSGKERILTKVWLTNIEHFVLEDQWGQAVQLITYEVKMENLGSMSGLGLLNKRAFMNFT